MLKLNIPIKPLKEFVSLCKFIQAEKLELMPILKYIKFEIDFGDLSITRDNTFEFLTYKMNVDCEDCSFILPYEKFSDYIASSTGEYFELKIDGSNVNAYDGKLRQKWTIEANVKVEDFPKLASINDTWFVFNKQLIDILGVSKNITKVKDDLIPSFSCSHVTPTCVYSTNQMIVFKKDMKNDIEESIPVTPKEVLCISNLPSVAYSTSNKSHNIWKSENVLYGFRRKDGSEKGFMYNHFFELISFPRKQYITISLNDIIYFCESTKKFRSGLVSNAILFVEGGRCILKYVDKALNEENELPINFRTTFTLENFEFIFNTDVFFEAVQKFPYSELSICIDKYTHEGRPREIAYVFCENDESIILIFPTLGRESL